MVRDLLLEKIKQNKEMADLKRKAVGREGDSTYVVVEDIVARELAEVFDALEKSPHIVVEQEQCAHGDAYVVVYDGFEKARHAFETSIERYPYRLDVETHWGLFYGKREGFASGKGDGQ